MGFLLCVSSLLLVGLYMIELHLVVGAPTADLISSLPGQPTVGFHQYSGYVTVDKTNNRNLFYYFVEASATPQSMPLTLWLNGGPGCSSIGGGGFSELGPFYPSSTGTALYQNPTAWNQISNVLFLESPAGVGFSYSDNQNDYNTNDEKTAQDALDFLLGWFAKFPEYNASKFYIAGESYAGHYVPQLAAAVLANNKLSGQPEINLQAVLIGNPSLDDTLDFDYGRLEYLATHGMLSQATYDTIQQECKFSESQPENEACGNAELSAQSESQIDSNNLNPYDVLSDVCLTSISRQAAAMNKLFGSSVDVNVCIDDEETTYLNLPEVQRALHAKATKWSICNSNINYERTKSSDTMVPVLQGLLHSGLRVWIMSGDADYVISVLGTRKVVNNLAQSLQLTVTSSYQPWYQGQQVGGWWTSWGDLAFITVRGAGHMIPQTQGARGLQIFRSFLSGSSLPNRAVKH